MTTEERKKFYREKLDEQRHLLRTAITGMAAGDLTQALHVATTIRVLVHETGASKPLLKHLNNSYLDLSILDRKEEPPEKHPNGVGVVVYFCPVSAQIKAPEGTVSLITDVRAEEHTLSKLGKWWSNVCTALPGAGAVLRKELILGLANKEGGAHVDADVSAKYKGLMESKFFNVKINEIDLGAIRVARLVAGRAGIELLDCLDRNFPVN